MNAIDDIHCKLTTKDNVLSKKEEEEEKEDKDEDGDEEMEYIDKMVIKYAENDGHSLTFLGDVTKIEMDNLKQNNIAAGK